MTSLTESCCEKIIDNCNAHCYLDKKIDGKDNETNGIAVEIKLKISEYIVNEYCPFLFTENNSKYITRDIILQTRDFCTEIEHPPKS